MTFFYAIVLQCNAPSCGRTTTIVDQNMSMSARMVARREGWAYRVKGGDLCPTHAKGD